MPSAEIKQARSGLLRRYSDLLLAALLVLLAVYLNFNLYPPVRFDYERIEVWAFPGQIQVSGLYHYRNSSPLPRSFSMGLPFPVDATHGSPSSFSISESNQQGTSLEEITPAVYHGDVTFRLWFGPGEDRWVRVDYVQGARVSGGRYILLTTREWRRPLDRGDYVLHLAPGLLLSRSNYELRPGPPHGGTYYFSRNDFYPAEDWEFTWREQPAATGGQP